MFNNVKTDALEAVTAKRQEVYEEIKRLREAIKNNPSLSNELTREAKLSQPADELLADMEKAWYHNHLQSLELEVNARQRILNALGVGEQCLITDYNQAIPAIYLGENYFIVTPSLTKEAEFDIRAMEAHPEDNLHGAYIDYAPTSIKLLPSPVKATLESSAFLEAFLKKYMLYGPMETDRPLQLLYEAIEKLSKQQEKVSTSPEMDSDAQQQSTVNADPLTPEQIEFDAQAIQYDEYLQENPDKEPHFSLADGLDDGLEDR